ncbi:hypothetical protein Y032_0024g1058 [Ancylostoma ceylanicum]|uniref:Uncharacterized protein n=1 Tax=Ancylostoma ceylanicum TaxID=53326 RepID=A0A016UX75_9BILA|nr:hypothetical protein Y032_0024g1058 [Ancylostoma ceylanicum]
MILKRQHRDTGKSRTVSTPILYPKADNSARTFLQLFTGKMLFRYAVILTAIAVTTFSRPVEKRQVRIGMVPIFDGRVTNEPITFTFTTAPPSSGPTAFPVQLENARVLPTLSPIDHKESLVQTNYHAFNEKWQYTPQTAKPTQTFSTPMYNQAQYYVSGQRLWLDSFFSLLSAITNSPVPAVGPNKTGLMDIRVNR